MSNLKFARDLFLETEELNRFKRFLFDEGIRLDFKNNVEELGIVYNQKYDPNFKFFKPETIGVDDMFKINPGYAYNYEGNVITSAGATFTIPLKDVWYWLRVRYKYSNIEKGTINIGGTNGGLMTGIGTKFTEVLRGQPNFPAKIKFVNSNNYTLEYEINEVVDDTTAYVQGSFQTFEQGISYAVVGTFTPGTYPADADKYPFQYDDFEYDLLQEVTLDTPPTLIPDYEFLVARVISRTTSGVEVQDKRYLSICKGRAERKFDEIPTKNNPLIAIESIGNKIIRSKLVYIVKIGIGFIISSENRDNNLNKVIITAGYGGRYNTANAFTTGDFDDMRYYYADGDYSRIITSTKVGATIELILDKLKHNVAGAMICPNAEEVEFKLKFFNEDGTSYYKSRIERFYSYTPEINIIINEDEISDGVSEVDIKTRYKTVFRVGADYDLNISTYNVQNIGAVTSNKIKLTTTGSDPTETAWRGIDVACELENIDPDIYYTLEDRDITTQPTEWNPNSTNPQYSTIRQTSNLWAKFYSDSGLTIPYSFTKNNLNVVVKRQTGTTKYLYDFPNPGDTTIVNNVIEAVEIITVNVAAANEVLLKNYSTNITLREHPTLDPLTFRPLELDIILYYIFPDSKIFEGRTGRKSFANLEQYYVATNLPTGVTKPNINTDTDYIAPSVDTSICPIEIPNFNLQYGYSLNVQEVTFTASSGNRSGLAVADTQSGNYVYIFKQFLSDEPVEIKAKVSTLASNNTTGLVWVRVTWRDVGANIDTYSQYQIPVNVLSTLPINFRNIRSVVISNF